MLQYYMKHLSRMKFKHDHTNSKRIDVDCTISTMIMSSNATNEEYTQDRIDVEELENFVTKEKCIRFIYKVCACEQIAMERVLCFFST